MIQKKKATEEVNSMMLQCSLILLQTVFRVFCDCDIVAYKVSPGVIQLQLNSEFWAILDLSL